MCIWKGPTSKFGIVYNGKTQILQIERWVFTSINDCLNRVDTRFVVGIIFIIFKTGDNHSNGIIFDKENKTITRFEPHGSEVNSTVYDSNILDNKLQIAFKGWIYQKPVDICPGVGPQMN